MSAVWGHISRGKDRSSVDTMASEYRRKCKLDGITETLFKNALIGFGQQIINEEDRHEAMPYIADGGDTIIVADAIIDNKDELIEELIPVRERPADASEIPSGKLITLAYEKWHYDLARHLKGLFSVAVYNTREGKLFLCVDQCACRCLYYHADDDFAYQGGGSGTSGKCSVHYRLLMPAGASSKCLGHGNAREGCAPRGSGLQCDDRCGEPRRGARGFKILHSPQD